MVKKICKTEALNTMVYHFKVSKMKKGFKKLQGKYCQGKPIKNLKKVFLYNKWIFSKSIFRWGNEILRRC